MRFLLFAFLLLFTLETRAEPFHVYAPSRSSDSLWVILATPSEEGLELSVEKQVDLGFSPATIVGHPELPLLYVSTNRGADAPAAVIRLDDQGKYLGHQAVTLAHGYSYLGLDRANRFLLGVNYGDGFVDVYSLNEEGEIGERVAALDEGRSAAHCVLPSPDNRYVYIPYVKDSNALYQYAFDPESGALTALDPKNANPPEGTGPRHLAYHPSLPLLYFSNEQHLGVSVYEKLDSGQLKVRQIAESGTDAQQGVSSSDIVMTPDARFLFAGIRGDDAVPDAIARYRIKDDGMLETLGQTPADAIPWGFALSPDARFLLVTAFKGETLMAFSVDQEGGLSRVATLEWDPQISDVVTR